MGVFCFKRQMQNERNFGSFYKTYIPIPTVVSATHSPNVNCMMGDEGSMEAVAPLLSLGLLFSSVIVSIFCRSSKTCGKKSFSAVIFYCADGAVFQI